MTITTAAPTATSIKESLIVSPVELPIKTVTLFDGTSAILRPMRHEDYPAVRQLIPIVSRSNLTLSDEELSAFLKFSNFYPYVAVTGDPSSSELIGYAELHRLPHLGRGFDARLEKVVVAEKARSNKLAVQFCTFLVEEVAKVALGAGRVDLTVEKPVARYIYEDKLKFKPVDTTVMRLMFTDPSA